MAQSDPIQGLARRAAAGARGVELDPIDHLTKDYAPGGFISSTAWLPVMGDIGVDLDALVVSGIVKKQPEGYYLATVEQMARRCEDRLPRIEQRGDRFFDVGLKLPSAPRAYAFDVAADEMAYGDRVVADPDRSDASSKSHAEYLALIEHCCAEARRRFYDEPGQDGVGEEIRKIAGLALRSIEQNRVKRRSPSGAIGGKG